KFPRQTHQMLLDSLAGKLGNGIAFLTCVEGDSLSLLSAVGKDAQKKVKAGDLIKELAKHADGRGGGRPDKAQAGLRRAGMTLRPKGPGPLAARRIKRLAHPRLGFLRYAPFAAP